jgi:hypothetical protein
MSRLHVARSVGRLVEVRFGTLQSVEAVKALGVALAQTVSKSSVEANGGTLVCADWRGIRVLAPEVAESLSALMKQGNQHVLRSAALIGTHAIFGLQVERVIRDAHHPARRAFRAGEELLRWLGEVGTAEECQRARQFLLEAEAALSVDAAPGSLRASG